MEAEAQRDKPAWPLNHTAVHVSRPYTGCRCWQWDVRSQPCLRWGQIPPAHPPGPLCTSLLQAQPQKGTAPTSHGGLEPPLLMGVCWERVESPTAGPSRQQPIFQRKPLCRRGSCETEGSVPPYRLSLAPPEHKVRWTLSEDYGH